jgi:hypothetical protein
MKRIRLSPSTVLAAGALFFALGGSALAVSEAVKPQARCSTGTVRGIVYVTGDPSKGIANFPSQFTSAKALIPRQFSCGAGAPQVRRLDKGTFEIRFPGNTATTALVSAAGGMGTVDLLNGVFKVVLFKPGQQDPPYDIPFSLVLV